MPFRMRKGAHALAGSPPLPVAGGPGGRGEAGCGGYLGFDVARRVVGLAVGIVSTVPYVAIALAM